MAHLNRLAGDCTSDNNNRDQQNKACQQSTR
jgi:hypothetical protein